KFDLTLQIVETGQTVAGEITYKTELFDRTTIERMARHFATLTAMMATEPGLPLWADGMLSAPERHELLIEVNDTECGYPSASCLHEMFSAQASRRADSVAVVCEARQVSYREIDRRANALAGHLQGIGVRPEEIVGILMGRTVEMVVAVLGVLKAGAAYLPL